MADILVHPLIRQAYELCQEIEKLPASDQQTKTITKAVALMDAVAAITDLRGTELATHKLQESWGREYSDNELMFRNAPPNVTVIYQGKEIAHIPNNIWASIVLNMSAYGERGGDWNTFMLHHTGQQDMLKGRRGGW
jgi:hypothetical protein